MVYNNGPPKPQRRKPKQQKSRESSKVAKEYLKKLENAENRQEYLEFVMRMWELAPVDTDDPAEIERRMYWYFEECLKRKFHPSITGLCTALGISRQAFYSWRDGNTKGQVYRELTQRASAIVETTWENGMLTGDINPVTGIFLGRNHFGYTNEEKITVEQNIPTVSKETLAEIQQRYLESAGLMVPAKEVEVTEAEYTEIKEAEDD